MSQVAFQLRADYEGKDFAGTVNVSGSDLYDVAAELQQGNGIIVTDDESVISALDAYPALKRTQVPDDRKSKEKPLRVLPSLAGTSGAANEGEREPNVAQTPAVRASSPAEPGAPSGRTPTTGGKQ